MCHTSIFVPNCGIQAHMLDTTIFCFDSQNNRPCGAPHRTYYPLGYCGTCPSVPTPGAVIRELSLPFVLPCSGPPGPQPQPEPSGRPGGINEATNPGRQAPRRPPPGNNGTTGGLGHPPTTGQENQQDAQIETKSDKEHRSHRPSYRLGLLGLHFDSGFDGSTHIVDNDWIYIEAQRGYNSALLNCSNHPDREFYLKVAPSTAHKIWHSASSLLSKIRPIFSLSFDYHRRVPSQLHPDVSGSYLKEEILNGFYALKALKSGSRRVQAVLVADGTVNHRYDSSIASEDGRLNTRSGVEKRISCLRGGHLSRHDSVSGGEERSNSDKDVSDYLYSENTFSDWQNRSISDEENPETAYVVFTRIRQRRNSDIATSRGSSRRTISSSRKRAHSTPLEHETDADIFEPPWKRQRMAAHHPRQEFCPEHAALNKDQNLDIFTNTPELDASNKPRRSKRRVKREYEFWPSEETREVIERNGNISEHDSDDQDKSETDLD